MTLLGWSEEDFLRHTEGSAIRRIGHERWLRNVAVALGNALRVAAPDVGNASGLMRNFEIINALHQRATHPSALVSEHVAWALESAIHQ